MPDIVIPKANLKASFPALLTGLAYCLLLSPLHPFPGMGGKELTILLQVEFLVMHSFLFLAITGGMGWGGWASVPDRNGKTLEPKYMRRFFWGLLALYLLVSFSMGWLGPFYFLAATSATYPVFLGISNRPSPLRLLPSGVTSTVTQIPTVDSPKPDPLANLEAWIHLGARWLFSFILYMVCISFADLDHNVDQWRPDAHTYWGGSLYFLGLGIMELTGLYDRLAAQEGIIRKIAQASSENRGTTQEHPGPEDSPPLDPSSGPGAGGPPAV